MTENFDLVLEDLPQKLRSTFSSGHGYFSNFRILKTISRHGFRRNAKLCDH